MRAVFLQAPSGSVPGLSDPVAIIIGTGLTLLVLYAIAAAHLRKTGRRM